MRRLRILTWHTHGSYLFYLTRVPHDFYVLSKDGRPPGYGGIGRDRNWGDNVHDLPVEHAREKQFDCIVFQDDAQYFTDQYEHLSAAQRALPRIYIEHDPPQGHPTDTPHPIDDPGVLTVHVTPFNALMWQPTRSAVRVIEHGVLLLGEKPHVGDLAKGLVVVNHLARRGRRLGADVFADARVHVPLDLVGMGAEELGGSGEVRHADLPYLFARYRFFFHPIRYTSLGLSVIEAMMAGLPVVGLATTELATVVINGRNGFIDTDVGRVIERMAQLLRDPGLARRLGERARVDAQERFGIDRFVSDWMAAFAAVCR